MLRLQILCESEVAGYYSMEMYLLERKDCYLCETTYLEERVEAENGFMVV